MAFSSRFWPPFMWLITSLFYSFQFFLRSAPNPLAEVLKQEFMIDAKGFGFLCSAYYISYAFLQIPLGIALDIWGPKKILRIGTILCVMGGLLFGFSTSFGMAVVGRFLIGTGAAVSFIGSIRMNSLWFSSAYLAFAVGLLSAMGKLAGGAAANAFLPKLIKAMPSWHMAIGLLCAIGGILTILVWIFVKNGPQDHFVSSMKKINFKVLGGEILRVAQLPIVWAMGFYGYSLYLTLSVFGDSYSTGFLRKVMPLSDEGLGNLSSLVMVGSAFGAATLSYLSDRFKQRLLFLRVSASMTLILSSLVFFVTGHSLIVMQMLLFSWGFFSGGQILIFVVSAESSPKGLSGMATGLTNALLMAGGAFHNPLFGYLLEFFRKGKTDLNGLPLYAIEDYQRSFLSFTFCFIVAFVISFLIKESHPSSQKKITTH